MPRGLEKFQSSLLFIGLVLFGVYSDSPADELAFGITSAAVNFVQFVVWMSLFWACNPKDDDFIELNDQSLTEAQLKRVKKIILWAEIISILSDVGISSFALYLAIQYRGSRHVACIFVALYSMVVGATSTRVRTETYLLDPGTCLPDRRSSHLWCQLGHTNN